MYNQPQNKTQQAYKLDQNLDRFEEFAEDEHKCDAEVIEPKRYGRSINQYFWYPEPIAEFERIEMEGTLFMFQGIDYLYTRPSLPVMSRRMLYVLNSIGTFPHQVISVSIKDNESSEYDIYKLSGKYNRHEYVAVQVLEESNFFDYEKSVYEPRSDTNIITDIDEMVLKEPSKGFPPLFRIPERPSDLYVSPQARAALEEANITGIHFIDLTLDNYRWAIDN